MRFRNLLITALLGLVNTQANAIDGLMISSGTGMTDMLIQSKNISDASQQSLGVFWDSDITFQNPLIGYGELEYELYYTQVSLEQKIQGVTFRPLFNFWGTELKERNWYWQFGVGLTYFDSKTLYPIQLSTNGQFATILGLGMRLDDDAAQRLTLRYNHYSNAYIVTPNQGLDTLSIDWHIRF